MARRVPLATTLIGLLRASRTLTAALPEVRMRALVETLRAVQTEEQAIECLLENLGTSPFIPQSQKDILAEMVLMREWDRLRAALQCDAGAGADASAGAGAETAAALFGDFRDMVVAVFTKSRKMRLLDTARRRALGAAIHSQVSVDGLKQLALSALETSVAFDGDARGRVANDILDDRYDLLLLPDRFDCEEVPRIAFCRVGAAAVGDGSAGGGGGRARDGAERSDGVAAEQAAADNGDDVECPVCLGTNAVETQLPCGHRFCAACIEEWAQRAPQCPMCRAPFDPADG